MKKLTIAYFGAPDFSAGVLEQILNDKDIPVSVKCVVTQPDRPAGRKQTLTLTPVKLLAQKHSIPVFDMLHAACSVLHEIDLVLLYAYGEIIPLEVLKLPRWGFWNIHPSLLPRFRGPSPIAYPLFLGETKTGVSLMEMDERMDTGPIIDQEEYSIQPTDTQETLKNKLSDIGYKLFKKNVQLLIDGALQKKEQDNSQATYTRLLTKQQGYIPFPLVQKIIQSQPLSTADIPSIIQEYCDKYNIPATNHQSLTTYYSLFRALSPWPGLWTLLRPSELKGSARQAHAREMRLKITGMALTANNQPLITRVQLEGKKELDWETFYSVYGACFS